jgi:hypothetical protein
MEGFKTKDIPEGRTGAAFVDTSSLQGQEYFLSCYVFGDKFPYTIDIKGNPLYKGFSTELPLKKEEKGIDRYIVSKDWTVRNPYLLQNFTPREFSLLETNRLLLPDKYYDLPQTYLSIAPKHLHIYKDEYKYTVVGNIPLFEGYKNTGAKDTLFDIVSKSYLDNHPTQAFFFDRFLFSPLKTSKVISQGNYFITWTNKPNYFTDITKKQVFFVGGLYGCLTSGVRAPLLFGYFGSLLDKTYEDVVAPEKWAKANLSSYQPIWFRI